VRSVLHPLQFAQHLFHLIQMKLLVSKVARAPTEIREHNALSFNVPLKRHLRRMANNC